MKGSVIKSTVGSQSSAHPTEHTIQNWQQMELGEKAMRAIHNPAIKIWGSF